MLRPSQVLRILRSTWVLMLAIVVAATALAYYSYEYAHEMARRGEDTIVETTRDAAQDRVSRIDSMILESDENIYNLVDFANLKDFPRRWSDISRISPIVESVVVVDENLKIAPDGLVSKRSKAEVDAFRLLFETQILKDLGLPDLTDGDHHLHKEYGDRYYLLSYTRREVNGHNYYIILEADLFYLVGDVFPDEFAGDGMRRLYQVVDEHGNLVFGHRFTGVPAKYLVSLVFPKTLWAWRLRMAPRDVSTLVAKASARQATDWIFIGMSAVTLFVGLGILTFAMRTERRANQLKSDFIANVSHELKTPLSLIRMFAELLATGRAKSESAREYAEIITRESERLSRLIDNVLDFAKLEQGKIGYDLVTGDLGEVLSRGLDVYRYRLDREGMKLTVEIAPDLPPVRVDENAMTLVLLNLVDNAVKYAAEGKELKVTTSKRDGRVLIEVADRGPGIPVAERARIFERFYRARHVRGRPVRGSGIGLSLVKHIAEAHGGGVMVDSVVGEGSTFTIWLPIAEELTPAPVAVAEPTK